MKSSITQKPVTVIMDRRSAINAALVKADSLNKESESVVLITGKGTDPYIMGPKGTKAPWLDSEVATEELKKILA